MNQYETTFIVDPVLSGDEIKQTAQMYIDHIKNEGCEIVHVEETGMRQLAYPINKRSAGAYYTVEFRTEKSDLIDNIELAFRRDDHILRYLSIRLDKHGVQYNLDKRAGKIGKKKNEETTEKAEA